MQVLNVELMFGDNETNIENRTLEIHIDDKYPLEFSIINARYDISSFEQNSVAKLQLKSISSTTNPINFNHEYKVYLYLKFPLNTFATNDKIVDLTFDEYNTATKNYNIEFTSLSQIEEKKIRDEENNKIFRNILIIIISVFVFFRLISAILREKEYRNKEMLYLKEEFEKIIIYENNLKSTYPYQYIENELDRLEKLTNSIYQRYKKELEKVFLKMQKTFITRKTFYKLNKKAKEIIEEAKNEFSNLYEIEKPIREKYRQEELKQEEEFRLERLRQERQMSYIDGLADGFMFEEYIANLLKDLGYINVEVTPPVGDFGVDVLAEKNGFTYAIQCKLYSNNNVGPDAVQQIYTGKTFYKRDKRSSCNKQLLFAKGNRIGRERRN